jgi:peroxiredoxin
VLALSIDVPEVAAQTREALGLRFPLLSDPNASVIRHYQMYNAKMRMSDMGYVLIDAHGRIRDRVRDPQFGERTETILQQLAPVESIPPQN